MRPAVDWGEATPVLHDRRGGPAAARRLRLANSRSCQAIQGGPVSHLAASDRCSASRLAGGAIAVRLSASKAWARWTLAVALAAPFAGCDTGTELRIETPALE